MNPPGGIEGEIYRDLKRTQPAAQGICVLNSSGKPLAWSLMFEDDASVLGFLDHAGARYADFSDASMPVATERFIRFPSAKIDDVADSGERHVIPDFHPEGEVCPGVIPVEDGALLARVVGRRVDAGGQPLSDARTQDNYIEDRFEIPRALQRAFVEAAKDSGGEAFRIPNAMARLLATNAYLGQLDVNPLGGESVGASATREDLRLWAKSVDGSRIELWGESNVSGGQSDKGGRTDGRQWEHRVTLDWRGVIVPGSDGMIQEIAILAEGTERLRWGNAEHYHGVANPVANLPAGRPIDFEGRVRYGLRAKN
jgi:hypothetical protein